MSEFRVEKRRESADVTLVSGATLSGSFFLAGSSQLHTGPERVGDILSTETGFFPFECAGETSLINRRHVLKVVLPTQMIEAQLDAGYDVATRRFSTRNSDMAGTRLFRHAAVKSSALLDSGHRPHNFGCAHTWRTCAHTPVDE